MTDESKNLEALDKYLEEYTWTIHSVMPNANARQYIDEIGIYIIVYLDSGDFELGYNVPKSTFSLKVKAGSFSREPHFKGFYDQITSMVAVLGSHPYKDIYWKTGKRISN